MYLSVNGKYSMFTSAYPECIVCKLLTKSLLISPFNNTTCFFFVFLVGNKGSLDVIVITLIQYRGRQPQARVPTLAQQWVITGTLAKIECTHVLNAIYILHIILIKLITLTGESIG